MAYRDKCKACSASVHVNSEDIGRMVDEIVNSPEFNIVTEKVYEERLNQCHNCDNLLYDTTCMQCGCIIQVRALLEDKDCPHPNKSRWCRL